MTLMARQQNILETVASLVPKCRIYTRLRDVYRMTDRHGRSLLFATDGLVAYAVGTLKTGTCLYADETTTVSQSTGEESDLQFQPLLYKWVMGDVERRAATPEFRAQFAATLKGIRTQSRYCPPLGREVSFGKSVAAKCLMPMLAHATHWGLDVGKHGTVLYLGQGDQEVMLVHLWSELANPPRG